VIVPDDDAGRDALVVTVAQHDRQRDHPHGDDRGCHRAGDCPEDRADEDHCVGESARDGAEQLTCAFEQVLGQAAAFKDRPHEREERDRQQQLVGQDAEHPQRQCLQEVRREIPERDTDDRKQQAERRQ
jgi:hypothetical protein